MPDSCPTWDLTDLYDGIADGAIAADIAACRQEAEQLEAAWQGRLADADGAALASSRLGAG